MNNKLFGDDFEAYGSDSLNNRDWRSREVKHNLRKTLAKLGLKSAINKKEQDLAAMIANLQQQVQQMYGSPDQLIMSPQSFAGLMKQLSPKDPNKP